MDRVTQLDSIVAEQELLSQFEGDISQCLSWRNSYHSIRNHWKWLSFALASLLDGTAVIAFRKPFGASIFGIGLLSGKKYSIIYYLIIRAFLNGRKLMSRGLIQALNLFDLAIFLRFLVAGIHPSVPYYFASLELNQEKCWNTVSFDFIKRQVAWQALNDMCGILSLVYSRMLKLAPTAGRPPKTASNFPQLNNGTCSICFAANVPLLFSSSKCNCQVCYICKVQFNEETKCLRCHNSKP